MCISPLGQETVLYPLRSSLHSICHHAPAEAQVLISVFRSISASASFRPSAWASPRPVILGGYLWVDPSSHCLPIFAAALQGSGRQVFSLPPSFSSCLSVFAPLFGKAGCDPSGLLHFKCCSSLCLFIYLCFLFICIWMRLFVLVNGDLFILYRALKGE